METKVNGRVRYTEEQIKDYLDQWKASGKSQISFSKESGINYYTFNKWLSDRKRKSKIVKERKTGFSPIKVIPESVQAFAELKREGNTIIIFHPVSADYLRVLLK